jgi:hypothetical protein
MLSTEMLSRCRTLLDEASAGFFGDTEIYSALTDGQQECANYFYNIYKSLIKVDANASLPESLEPLYTIATGTATLGVVNKPADFWGIISATFNTSICKILPLDKALFSYIENTYTQPTTTSPIVYQASSSTLMFLPATSSGYILRYIKIPTVIASATNPILSKQTHTAIVHWATAQMLFKDQRPQEAQLHLQNFINELQTVG